jgi:hypothetical protein
VKVIAFFVKPVSAGSELDLNWNLDRAQTGRLLDYFLVCSVLVRLNRHLDQDQPEKCEMTPMAIFGFPYKMGLLPQCFLGFLSFICTTIVDLHKLSSSLFPPMILASF